jgi:hypothetical protein
MRFLKGWLGTFAGLTLAMTAISLFNGSFANLAANPLDTVIPNAVMALAFAGVTAMVEKFNWGPTRYALVNGGITMTALLALFFVLFSGSPLMGMMGAVDWLFIALTSFLSGVGGGLGYRVVAGAKSPE